MDKVDPGGVPLADRASREERPRWAIKQFVEHYHRERPHQGLGSRIIDPEPNVGSSKGAIVRRMRLGGLLNYYHRVAA
jgi:putative transposase